MRPLLSWLRACRPHLTPTGRERLRRLREAETEAILAADRMRRAGQLASIGAYHLRFVDLTRQESAAEHPDLAECTRDVVEALADAIRDEVDGYRRRGREALP